MNRKPNDEEAESYSNDEGMTVFTAEYLLSRGYCCGNGCRHCPFEYIEVKEPRRSQLLQARRLREGSSGKK